MMLPKRVCHRRAPAWDHRRDSQWNGDARGRWEGNTLVVDWTNFTEKQEFQGEPQGTMRFTERFTKVDANTINYEVTVTDPATWTRPWTFVLPWRADDLRRWTAANGTALVQQRRGAEVCPAGRTTATAQDIVSRPDGL